MPGSNGDGHCRAGMPWVWHSQTTKLDQRVELPQIGPRALQRFVAVEVLVAGLGDRDRTAALAVALELVRLEVVVNAHVGRHVLTHAAADGDVEVVLLISRPAHAGSCHPSGRRECGG